MASEGAAKACVAAETAPAFAVFLLAVAIRLDPVGVRVAIWTGGENASGDVAATASACAIAWELATSGHAKVSVRGIVCLLLISPLVGHGRASGDGEANANETLDGEGSAKETLDGEGSANAIRDGEGSANATRDGEGSAPGIVLVFVTLQLVLVLTATRDGWGNARGPGIEGRANANGLMTSCAPRIS
jgi:hypothetical protein